MSKPLQLTSMFPRCRGTFRAWWRVLVRSGNQIFHKRRSKNPNTTSSPAPTKESACPALTWSSRQKICASSCWKRRTLVKPVSVPLSSFLCKTPKSANRNGSSRYDRSRNPNIMQCPGQFMGFNANCSFSTSKLNIFS